MTRRDQVMIHDLISGSQMACQTHTRANIQFLGVDHALLDAILMRLGQFFGRTILNLKMAAQPIARGAMTGFAGSARESVFVVFINSRVRAFRQILTDVFVTRPADFRPDVGRSSLFCRGRNRGWSLFFECPEPELEPEPRF